MGGDWGVWDTWKSKWCGRIPFRASDDAVVYAALGNRAEGERRYEARPMRTNAKCRCGLKEIPAGVDIVSWYWQEHGREKCVLLLPNERCECGLLRSEHTNGHAPPTSD